MKQQKVAKFSTYVFRLQKNKELSWEHQALLKQILRDKFLVKVLKKRPEASLRFSSEANSGGKREAMLADFKEQKLGLMEPVLTRKPWHKLLMW